MADARFRMEYLDWQKQPEVCAFILSQAFARMEKDGTVATTFYDGSVSSASGFVADLCRPGSLPYLLFWEGKPVGVVWCNSVEGRAVRGHFVMFKSVWGRKRTVPIGRGIFETLMSFRDADGYLFDVLLGLTPKSNPFSWRLALQCGARMVGVIPHGVYVHSHGGSEDAVLTATTRESIAEEGR